MYHEIVLLTKNYKIGMYVSTSSYCGVQYSMPVVGMWAAYCL